MMFFLRMAMYCAVLLEQPVSSRLSRSLTLRLFAWKPSPSCYVHLGLCETLDMVIVSFRVFFKL